jgi:branched-chain amino acid transport system substrate-binding protein
MRKNITASAVIGLFAAALSTGALAQKISDDVVKIGVLTDMSGVYSDLAGRGSVIAAEMAVADFSKNKTILGKKIEVVFADHQNKADITANKAREWIDKEKVDVIVDLVTTSAALAAMEIAEQKNKITLVSGAASVDITGPKCTANNVHWVYDTYNLGKARESLVKSGKKTWFFVTADYTFGHNLERDTAEIVRSNGGTVVGSVRHPFPGSDFSSFLLKAQSSGAQVIGLANAGQDTINSVKQAAEFGINQKQTIVPLLTFITDVHSLGLQAAQGLSVAESFYWDMNDRTRAWSKRFFGQHKRMPSMVHAGVYSSVMAYLKAIEATKTDDTAAVMAHLKSKPIDDGLFKGNIRVDGKFDHDFYVFEVKKPAESKTPWDYYHVRATIPAKEASAPLNPACKLVKR